MAWGACNVVMWEGGGASEGGRWGGARGARGVCDAKFAESGVHSSLVASSLRETDLRSPAPIYTPIQQARADPPRSSHPPFMNAPGRRHNSLGTNGTPAHPTTVSSSPIDCTMATKI